MPVLCCRHLVIYKKAKVLFISYLFGTFYHVMPKLMQCQHASRIVHAKGVNLSSNVIFYFSRNIFAAVSLKWEHPVHT